MDELAYNTQVAQVFRRLLKALDVADPDVLECDSTGDMLTIVATASKERVVINTQRAVHQIWVAGNGSGVHFDFDGPSGQWKDDKRRGLELFAWVATCVRAASGFSATF